jgi:hypothetical protein
VAIDNVLEHALALDATQRAELAAALLRSLEPDDRETLDEAEWNAAWSAELQRRLRDLEDGRTQPIAQSEAAGAIAQALMRAVEYLPEAVDELAEAVRWLVVNASPSAARSRSASGTCAARRTRSSTNCAARPS